MSEAITPELMLGQTLKDLPGPPYTTDHRFLALASALTTWPVWETAAIKVDACSAFHPWAATLVTTLCETQQDLDLLRSALASLALNGGMAVVLSEEVVKQAMQARLIEGPYGAQWTVAAKAKPQIKMVARVIMEAALLRDMVRHKQMTAGGFKPWVEKHSPTPGELVLAVSGLWAGYHNSVACIPEVVLFGGSGAAPEGWAIVLYESLTRNSTSYGWNKAKVAPAEMLTGETASPVPTPKPVVDQQAAAKKLFEDIKVMIKTEVQTAIAANSSLLESMVKTVIVSTPTLLDKAMAKVIAQQTSTTAFGGQLQKAIGEAMATVNIEKHVEAAAQAHVSTKLDVAKIRKDVVDKVMANNDEYFAALFDRIVVTPVPPGQPWIGKLAMKAPIDPKALPTLPGAASSTEDL